jgi:phosphoglucosamine mutase
MGRKYFGTDGIRGHVGQSPITPDFVMRLGYAAGKVLAHEAASGGRSPKRSIKVSEHTKQKLHFYFRNI